MDAPKYIKYLEDGRVPCTYTMCKSTSRTTAWKYLLVIEIKEQSVFGLLFNHDNSFRCIGHFDLDTFDTEWSWDKTEDEFGSTHYNEDYIYLGDSIYKLKLEVRGE